MTDFDFDILKNTCWMICFKLTLKVALYENILTIIMITYLETRCIPDSCHLARSKIKTRNVIQKIEKMVRIFLFLL